MKSQRIVVTFSGIDGAGKTTQIDALLCCLKNRGNRVRLYRFWDDVVVFSRGREHLSLRIFKGEKGIGQPDRPIARRDKNVTSWYVLGLRVFLYLLDAVRLGGLLLLRRDDADYVIFDRYIYDELANLPVRYWPAKLYVRFLLQIVPKPHLAILLDADPEIAISRKPEYPLEFVRQNRCAYLDIAAVAGMKVLSPASAVETTRSITDLLTALNSSADHSVAPEERGLSAEDAETPSG